MAESEFGWLDLGVCSDTELQGSRLRDLPDTLVRFNPRGKIEDLWPWFDAADPGWNGGRLGWLDFRRFGDMFIGRTTAEYQRSTHLVSDIHLNRVRLARAINERLIRNEPILLDKNNVRLRFSLHNGAVWVHAKWEKEFNQGKVAWYSFDHPLRWLAGSHKGIVGYAPTCPIVVPRAIQQQVYEACQRPGDSRRLALCPDPETGGTESDPPASEDELAVPPQLDGLGRSLLGLHP